MRANLDKDEKLLPPRNVERGLARLKQLRHEIRRLGNEIFRYIADHNDPQTVDGEWLSRAKKNKAYLRSEAVQLAEWLAKRTHRAAVDGELPPPYEGVTAHDLSLRGGLWLREARAWLEHKRTTEGVTSLVITWPRSRSLQRRSSLERSHLEQRARRLQGRAVKRAYVGNVPFTITEDELRAWFAPYKIKEVQLVHDRTTGRPRGFAFVEFETEAEFEAALHSHNDQEIEGRRIVVNDATEKRRPR